MNRRLPGTDVHLENDVLKWGERSLDRLNDTPQDLTYVLGTLGRKAIVDTIENLYAQAVARNPDAVVSRPSIYAVDLGKSKKDVLTAFGQRNRTNLHRSIIEARPVIRGYWDTISAFDFTPEILSGMGSRNSPQNWLLLRNPETDPPLVTPLEHLPRALGFIEPAITSELRPELHGAWKSGDAATYKALRTKYLDATYDAMDRQRDSFDDPIAYELAGIGQIIASANLRAGIEGESYLLDPDGYEAALEDAKMSAFEHYEVDIDTTLQTELDRIHALRNNSSSL